MDLFSECKGSPAEQNKPACTPRTISEGNDKAPEGDRQIKPVFLLLLCQAHAMEEQVEQRK